MDYTIVENEVEVGLLPTYDPDGDSLTFSVGGEDGDLFEVTSTGIIKFKSPPNFDQPSDFHPFNLYLLEVTVSDGQLSSTASVTIDVQNDSEGLTPTRFARSEYSHALAAAYYPGEDWQLLTITQQGQVRTFDLDGNLISDVTLGDRPSSDFTYLGLGVERSEDLNLLFTLLQVGGNLEVWVYPIANLAAAPAQRIWSRDYFSRSQSPGGSLACNPNCYLATANISTDGVLSEVGDGFGDLIALGHNGSSSYDDPSSYWFKTVAGGLRDPIAVWGEGRDGGEHLVLDNGILNVEVNYRANLSCSDGGAGDCLVNYGWPYFDGSEATGVSAPGAFEHVLPSYSRPQSGATGWTDIPPLSGLAFGLSIGDIDGKVVLGSSDSYGPIYSLSADLVFNEDYDDEIPENRSIDFSPYGNNIGSIYTLFSIPAMAGSAIGPSLFILDQKGDIFILRGS